MISGKTGTTNGPTNAWFNAFTGNLVGSVWFGNDDNTTMTGAMTRRRAAGADLARRSWPMRMRASRPSRPSASPPISGSAIVAAAAARNGAGVVEAPRQTGLSPQAAQIILEIGDYARAAEKRSAITPATRYAAGADGAISILRPGAATP